MTDPDSGAAPDSDRYRRRAVWIAFAITMIGAAIVYKHKAEDDRSAIIRWFHQVRELRSGVNIWVPYYFPNPPIFAITLYPLSALEPVTGAVAWFALKAALAAICMAACMRMAVPPGARIPWWAQAGMILLCLRPVMGDLHHANNNLIILSLIVATLVAWRRGHDVLAGLCLGLAITYKVTPALFLPYFIYKRSWKVVAVTLVGIVIFLIGVPSLVLGPRFNIECLTTWWQRIVAPYVEKGVASPQEVNQSMVGVLTRLLTPSRLAGKHRNGGTELQLNLVSWAPDVVSWIVKGLSLGFVGLLALFCRSKAARRDDPRLFGEFSLVVLTMLFISERSWKHHYVTLILPFAYLVARVAVYQGTKTRKYTLTGLMTLAAFLMACTSPEFGFLFGKDGHKVAQFYGLFFLAGLVLYLATAWLVVAERESMTGRDASSKLPVPAPHVGTRVAANRTPIS